MNHLFNLHTHSTFCDGKNTPEEINTGAITRKLRTTPYPSTHLLHVLKKQGAKLILSSDSHEISTLDGAFEETANYLYDIGFRHMYAPSAGGFAKIVLKI